MSHLNSNPVCFSSEGTWEISQLRSGWYFAKKNIQVPQGRRTFTVSVVLSGRNFFRAVFQPLRSRLISSRRFATQIALAAVIAFFVFGAKAQTTNALSDAEIQGRALVQKILTQQPPGNFTNTGVLKIRDANGNDSQIPVKFETIVKATNWCVIYQAFPVNGLNEELSIFHNNNLPDKYYHHAGSGIGREPEIEHQHVIFPGKTGEPFAHSDFSIGDLGLDFFHWPEQTVLKKKLNQFKGRDYTLLESTNPQPSPKSYSRVVSWIDNETLGLLQADAYDNDGKLLKEFYPKDFKKVDGQWQVQTLVIENEQTGSRSRLEFDLKK